MPCEDLKWSEDVRCKDSNSKDIPESAGVYKISVQLKNGKLRSIYVGQADNLKARFLQHLSTSEANPCIKKNVSDFVCYFRYTLVPRQEDRNAIEKHLLKRFSYECNQQNN